MADQSQLDSMIQRMIDAGESEENIAAVIKDAKTPKPATAPPPTPAEKRTEREKAISSVVFQGLEPEKRGWEQIKKQTTENLPALGAMAVSAGFVNPATTTAMGRMLGPASKLANWVRPAAVGAGATGGAAVRGDQPMDAVEEGAKTMLLDRYLPTVIDKVVAGPGRYLVGKGKEVARAYLKPSLDAGRKEAQRLFGRPAMASQANEKVVERVLDRNILGSDNPEQAIADALEAAEKQLKGVVGDQPTKLNELMKVVNQRGHQAAVNQARNIPGAQDAIDAEIQAVGTGSLGGKLDFGTARPPVRQPGNVSAAPLLRAMQGSQASAGTIAPPNPKLIHGLQRIQAQPGGGNITTGVPIVTQEVQGPALATSRVEAPMSGQTPRRYAGSGGTEVMREAPPSSPTGAVIGRNFTPPVEVPPSTSPTIAHQPKPITAKEALKFSRGMSNEANWDKAPTSLVNWFRRAQESAGRTAVKEAVPQAREHLNEIGELISAQRVVPQAMNREMNKNTVARLPAMLAAVATGHPVKAGVALAGINLADKNAGKIGQQLYNAGKRMNVSPEMIRNLSQTAEGLALMQLLKQRSGDQK